MNPSQPFILRPVATTLLMIAIMLSGMLAFRFLPVAALPEVDYPTIQVQTFYPGASPDVMASSVTSPLERQFGQLPGLKQMTSTSSFGASLITLQFTLDYAIDVAEQQVQAAINAAATFLPRDLPKIQAPSLFVSGSKDPFGSPAEIQSALQLVPAPVSFLLIEGAGHDLGYGRRIGKAMQDVPTRIVRAFFELFATANKH